MSTNDPWSSPHQPEGSDPYANPYESNPYESNPYGPNPYGPPGPYQPMPHPGYYGALPKHPGVSTALVLSLVSLAGFACIIPFLTAPIGMILGLKAHREIKEQPDRWSGDGEAMAAFVVGLVITVLLLLIVIGVVVAVALSPDTY